MSRRENSVIPFLLISLSLHALLFISWPRHKSTGRAPAQIPVSFLPPLPAPQAPRLKTKPEPKRTPPPKSRAAEPDKKIAKVEKPPPPAPRPIEKAEKPPDPPPETRIASPRESRPETHRADVPITERRLPSVKELLPPVTWSPSRDRRGSREGPIRLDTRETKYVSYFEHVKRAIELVWEYPDNALHHGLQGKLLLEFSILGNGTLEGPRLVRSSGFSELDEEAIRAVRAAAPFRPIPSHIGRPRLDIIASFEYHDNRWRYDLGR